jgi:hypothetical protein
MVVGWRPANAAERVADHLGVGKGAQVLHHQESTERQYALRAMALELGWSESAIVDGESFEDIETRG